MLPLVHVVVGAKCLLTNIGSRRLGSNLGTQTARRCLQTRESIEQTFHMLSVECSQGTLQVQYHACSICRLLRLPVQQTFDHQAIVNDCLAHQSK